jgi:hypothetical protein
LRTYHLLLADDKAPAARRITVIAESPDHALVVAEAERMGVRAELWDGARLLARMTKTAPHLWLLHPCHPSAAQAPEAAAAVIDR